MPDQFLALATCRNPDFDFALALCRQGRWKQIPFLAVMRCKNAAWGPFIVVELCEECAENLARADRTVRFRKVCAVAPVLPRAEEEHLDARESPGLMHSEYIGLFD